MNKTIAEAYGTFTAKHTPFKSLKRDLRIGKTLFYAHHGISSIKRSLIFNMKDIKNSIKQASIRHRIAPAKITILAVSLENF